MANVVEMSKQEIRESHLLTRFEDNSARLENSTANSRKEHSKILLGKAVIAAALLNHEGSGISIPGHTTRALPSHATPQGRNRLANE